MVTVVTAYGNATWTDIWILAAIIVAGFSLIGFCIWKEYL